MKVVFFRSSNAREGMLAEAFAEGVKAHGDDAEIRVIKTGEELAEDAGAIVLAGVKSREIYWRHWREGTNVIYLDKGYMRHLMAGGPVRQWEYWRAAVNGHHPTRYLGQMRKPTDRLERLEVDIKPWRKSGSKIIFAGSSEKYHEFYGLHDPTRYAERVVRNLKDVAPGMRIVYRPKPSWKGAVPVAGAAYSRGADKIGDALKDAHALVTHGSNACFEAVLHGVPCIILGDGVAKPISDTSLHHVMEPRLATDAEREQWLANLAYCQWTLAEYATGEAWKTIRPQLFGIYE